MQLDTVTCLVLAVLCTIAFVVNLLDWLSAKRRHDTATDPHSTASSLRDMRHHTALMGVHLTFIAVALAPIYLS